MTVIKASERALRRKRHVRRKVLGTAKRPRLSVFRSNRHLYAQIIDDVEAVTLVSASTASKALRAASPRGGNVEAARLVGEAVAKLAIDMGINCVFFDRGSYKYHGRVKALAEAARKAGLAF
jgi:large subunit ribosomal protein L18